MRGREVKNLSVKSGDQIHYLDCLLLRLRVTFLVDLFAPDFTVSSFGPEFSFELKR